MTPSSAIAISGNPRSPGAAPPGATTSLREFLVFKLGAAEHGVDILRVQAIPSCEEPTIGSVDDRMLILPGIEKLMSGPEMGLVEPTLP